MTTPVPPWLTKMLDDRVSEGVLTREQADRLLEIWKTPLPIMIGGA